MVIVSNLPSPGCRFYFAVARGSLSRRIKSSFDSALLQFPITRLPLPAILSVLRPVVHNVFPFQYIELVMKNWAPGFEFMPTLSVLVWNIARYD